MLIIYTILGWFKYSRAKLIDIVDQERENNEILVASHLTFPSQYFNPDGEGDNDPFGSTR